MNLIHNEMHKAEKACGRLQGFTTEPELRTKSLNMVWVASLLVNCASPFSETQLWG